MNQKRGLLDTTIFSTMEVPGSQTTLLKIWNKRETQLNHGGPGNRQKAPENAKCIHHKKHGEERHIQKRKIYDIKIKVIALIINFRMQRKDVNL